MTAIKAIGKRTGQWLDNHINPILVKDVRATLRSKRFMIVFFTALGLVLFITSLYTLQAFPGSLMGIKLFEILMLGMTFTLTGVLPYLVQDRFAEELSSRSMELVLISNITPKQLVRGKILGGICASLLFYSIAGPSFMIAYMLGGIPLDLIIYCTAMLLFLSSAIMALAVLLASMTGKKKKSWALSVIFIGCGYVTTSFMGMILTSFIYGNWFSRDNWTFSFVLGGLVTMLLVFFYITATSRLSFEADNRDTRPRAALCILAFGSFLVAVAIPFIEVLISPASGIRNFIPLGTFTGMVFFVFGAMFLLNTPENLSIRVKNDWPRGRVRSTLFYPGTGRLYAFFVFHLCFFTGVSLLATVGKTGNVFIHGRDTAVVAALTPVICGFALLFGGLMAHRILCRRKLKRLPRARVVVLVVIAWIVLGIMVAVLVDGDVFPGIIHVFFPMNALFYILDSSRDAIERFATMITLMSPLFVTALYVMAKDIVAAFKQHGTIRKEKMVNAEHAAK